MPGIIDVILRDKDLNIDGFICPGHVAAVTGTNLFEPIVKKTGLLLLLVLKLLIYYWQ